MLMVAQTNAAFFWGLVLYILNREFQNVFLKIGVFFLLASFPTSFFLIAAYTESTFMLFLLAYLYCCHRRKHKSAALCGYLCTASRIAGIGVPLVQLLADIKSKFNKSVIIHTKNFVDFLPSRKN